MGLFGKKKLTETEAAGQFVITVMKGVQQHWPEIVNELKGIFQGEASVLDYQYASFEFSLAVIATQIQALPNLLPSDQANRIREHVLKCISSPELAEYPREAIQEYQNAWEQSLKKSEPPFYSIASVLFDKLGCQSNVKVVDGKLKDPLLMMVLSEKVVTFGGPLWKNVIQEYKFVP